MKIRQIVFFPTKISPPRPIEKTRFKNKTAKKLYIFSDHILIWFGAQIRSKGAIRPLTPHPHRRSRIQKPNPKPPHNIGKNKRSPWRKARTKTGKKARQTKRDEKNSGNGIRPCVSWNFLRPVFMRPLTYETFYSSIGLGMFYLVEWPTCPRSGGVLRFFSDWPISFIFRGTCSRIVTEWKLFHIRR